MIDFDPAWIYHLSEDLTRLEAIRADAQMADFARILITARSMVDEVLSHQQHTLFPNTCEDLVLVLEAIDAIAPPDARLVHQMHVLTVHEVLNIKTSINRAVDTFERECSQKYIVGLERQRALEPKTLIEEIESAISPECWKRLSRPTMREVEECGKCLAFERYTAAGFHMLRGIESEVLDYIALLPVPTPTKRDLGHYIGILRDHGADAKLIATLDNIRSLDRNPLMHPQDWLDRDQAIGIFNTAQTAFERLVADMERRKLLPAV
jgi:hypothetical protein